MGELAHHIVVISHRWIDRFSCDVPTDQHPYGLRLENLHQRLTQRRPKEWSCTANYRWHMLAGWDILVFFDFMALPQVGVDANGDELPRTEAETQIFAEALPLMGTLYSIYPVLVLPEVTAVVHPYRDSGWCFSEFVTALLGRQLGLYSPEIAEDYFEPKNIVDEIFATVLRNPEQTMTRQQA